MFFIYNLILPIIALIFSPIILIAFVLQPKFRAGFFQKIGFYKPIDTDSETVVFHAVSVGEVNAIASLVKKTREVHPELNIILTTTTKTGQEVAKKSLSDFVNQITYFPYDFFFSVNAFLNSYKPSKVIIAETEIWPGFASIAKSKGIKVYIVNGRISPNSYKGYKKFSFFFKKILEKYELILMQSDSDAQRIIDIGANPEKTKVMGNLKFDIAPSLNDEQIENIRQSFKLADSKLLVAASTHSGEDEIVLEVFSKSKKSNPDLKLLLAPRHPQRYEQVENLIKTTGFSYGRRSNNDTFDSKEIIMLDTMGELSKLFSISYLAFIGGSFSNTGGHNPLEASIWNKPVLSGPTVFNFKDIYKLLTEKGAAIIVETKESFYEELTALLNDSSEYSRACLSADEVFKTSKGAIQFVLDTVF